MDSYLQLTGQSRYLESIGSRHVHCAWLICQRFGVAFMDFMRALETFSPPPHRMEDLGTIRGVRWINDSKATNPGAVLYGVQRLNTRCILIAGGKSKGVSFSDWKRSMEGTLKAVCLIGEAAEEIGHTLTGLCPLWHCRSLKEAVARCHERAIAGDTVILSPGCASFDQFRDYAHRGSAFKEYVNEMRKER